MDKAIGIDLGGTSIKFGLVGQDGSILKQGQKDSGGKNGSKDILLRMEEAVHEALSGTRLSEIKGIGIGTPGLVNSEGTVFLAPNFPNWHNIPLAEIFWEKFKLPVKVDNDVNAVVWGEYLFGAGKGFCTIICITLGTGLGGGIVVDGKLLRGINYSAVELGHITINTKGPRCGCGNKGCVETYVGSARIVAKTKKYLKKDRSSIIPELVNHNLDNITPKIISEAYRKGDRLAARIWEETGANVGVMLAGLVNVFNPEAIVIGGGIALTDGPLFSAIREEITKRAFPLLSKDIKILHASLRQRSGIKGAAALVF
ncbi:MAG: ROK family protein [Candidatus Ratteibacteria bacterium]|jgi:glucokinase